MHGNLQERNTVLLEIPLEEKGTLVTLLTWAWPVGSAVNHLRSRPTDPSTRPANGGRRTRPDRRVIRHAASRTGPRTATVRPLTSSRARVRVMPSRHAAGLLVPVFHFSFFFFFGCIPFFLVPALHVRPPGRERRAWLASTVQETPRHVPHTLQACNVLLLYYYRRTTLVRGSPVLRIPGSTTGPVATLSPTPTRRMD